MIEFEVIIEKVKKYTFDKTVFNIDDIKNLVNKLVFVISINDEVMISLEILSDATVDFCAVTIDSEEIISIGTKYYKNEFDLEKGIYEILDSVQC